MSLTNIGYNNVYRLLNIKKFPLCICLSQCSGIIIKPKIRQNGKKVKKQMFNVQKNKRGISYIWDIL